MKSIMFDGAASQRAKLLLSDITLLSTFHIPRVGQTG